MRANIAVAVALFIIVAVTITLYYLITAIPMKSHEREQESIEGCQEHGGIPILKEYGMLADCIFPPTGDVK